MTHYDFAGEDMDKNLETPDTAAAKDTDGTHDNGIKGDNEDQFGSETKVDNDESRESGSNVNGRENLDEKEWRPIREFDSDEKPKCAAAPSRSKQETSPSMSRGRSQAGSNSNEHGNSESDDRADAEAIAEKDPYEVDWEDGEKDPLNPRSKSYAVKWAIVLICSFASLCVTCASSIYTSTYEQITLEFHSSQIIATLGLSLFVMGLGTGPMALSPLSEFYGRRPIYLISFSFFLIWLIPSAVAKNMATMLVARFFDGLSGSAFLSVAGGTVGDLFNRDELQAPMMIYTAAPFIGPSLGPLIGGFINQNTSWRWTFYVLLIWTGGMLLSIALFVPETYHPVLLTRKAEKKRKETGDERWRSPQEKANKSKLETIKLSLYRPFQLLFLEPMCLNLCLFSAILLGILYLFFGSFALVFRTNHHFTLSQIGLSFLGIFLGMMLGISTDPLWHKNYLRLVKKREEATGEKGSSEPEFRLPPSIAGAPLVCIGLFWFGWTTYESVHWIVPIIGSTIFGMGTLLVFSGIFTFLVDAYPLYAASALAANSFARSSFAAAFPLFGIQMYKKLGYQWATTLLAGLTVLMLPFPYIFFIYGKRIRGVSRFASAK